MSEAASSLGNKRTTTAKPINGQKKMCATAKAASSQNNREYPGYGFLPSVYDQACLEEVPLSDAICISDCRMGSLKGKIKCVSDFSKC